MMTFVKGSYEQKIGGIVSCSVQGLSKNSFLLLPSVYGGDVSTNMHVISEEEMDTSMTTGQHQLPYIHPLTHAHIHPLTHTEAHTHTHTQMYPHMHTHTDVSTHAHTDTYIYSHMHTQTHIYIHTCTNTEPETKCNPDQRIHSMHNFISISHS